MKDLTSAELIRVLRTSFPEMNAADFDEDLDTFTGSRCGVLMAFSWQFNQWVRRQGRAGPPRPCPDRSTLGRINACASWDSSDGCG